LNQFIDAFLFTVKQPVPFSGFFFSKLTLGKFEQCSKKFFTPLE